jgi:hypothetical protein
VRAAAACTIVRAATVALDCARDRRRGQRGQGRLDVLRQVRPRRETADPRIVEVVAPGALGRRAIEEGVGDHRREQRVDHRSPGRPTAVVVVRRAEMPRDPCVDQDVAGAGVESAHGSVRPEVRHVGNAADVRDHAMHA